MNQNYILVEWPDPKRTLSILPLNAVVDPELRSRPKSELVGLVCTVTWGFKVCHGKILMMGNVFIITLSNECFLEICLPFEDVDRDKLVAVRRKRVAEEFAKRKAERMCKSNLKHPFKVSALSIHLSTWTTDSFLPTPPRPLTKLSLRM